MVLIGMQFFLIFIMFLICASFESVAIVLSFQKQTIL